MRKQMARTLVLTAAFLTGCSGIQAAPVLSKQGADASKQLLERYTWYDGEQPRQVWLDPALIAEFTGSDKGGSDETGSDETGSDEAARSLRAVAPQAAQVPTEQRGIRLWRVDSDAPRTLRSLRSIQAAGKFSPVLRDAAGPDARMRALPGNVIVYLQPAWSRTQMQSWLSAQGLEVVRKLDFAPNVYLIRSEPGLASLELANRLYKTDEVVAAMPDWWQEVETR